MVPESAAAATRAALLTRQSQQVVGRPDHFPGVDACRTPKGPLSDAL